MRPLLSLAGVHTHIGAYHILHGVDLEVPAGQTTLLLGRNGAGKTTTLRTIMGLWQASSGQVSFDGQDITKRATPEIALIGPVIIFCSQVEVASAMSSAIASTTTAMPR